MGASSSPMASACATDTRSSIAIDWFIRCVPPRCHQSIQGTRSLTYSIACSRQKDKRGDCGRGSQPRARNSSEGSERAFQAFVVSEPGVHFFKLCRQLQKTVFATVGGTELDTDRQPASCPVHGH